MARAAGFVASAVMIAGCRLAPEYHRPAARVEDAWRVAATPAATNGVVAADLDWHRFFDDPRLLKLIGLALENNQDLKVATLRIEQMRAQYRIRRSDLLPGIQADGGLVRRKTSGAITDFNGGTVQSVYSVNLDAAYELDLFGRIRGLRDAALEKYLSTEEARKSLQITLVSEVATEFLVQSRLREAKAIAGRTLETVEAARKLIARRYEAGAASELELRTAEGQVQAVKVNAAGFLQQLAESENALVLLVGQPLPDDLPAARPFAAQSLLGPVPAGVPSETLQRRPDVLEAEHLLKASNADIGAVRANYFPRIQLTGSAGTASAKLTDLFSPNSGTWSFAPQVTIPVFDLIPNRSRVATAKVEREVAIARYQKTVQTAFREVADALAVRAILDGKVQAQQLLLDSQRRRFALTNARYEQGVDSHVDVLLAQQDLYASEQNLLQFQAARLLNSVELYRSLGGGWNAP